MAVRVCNLEQRVCEKDLKRYFSPYGSIAKCRVIRNDEGLSEGYGYVNFQSEEDAEIAAKEMNNFKIYSLPIRTIGPKALARKASDRRQELADCHFYVLNGRCRDEIKCPFRHLERVRYSTEVCSKWEENKCSDIFCSHKHPYNPQRTSDMQWGKHKAVQVAKIHNFAHPPICGITLEQPIPEGRRLCSEVRHLLISHPEHAMTLIELAEHMKILSDDVQSPSVEELYQCLREKPDTFIIGSIPKSTHRKTVELNEKDRYRKLQSDILHIFIYKPSEDFSLPVRWILDFYSECYGHSLDPSIYDCNAVADLMRKPAVVEMMEMNQKSGLCSLTKKGMITVISSLFAELIYSRGGSISLNDLPGLYQDYFGVQLNLCGAPSLSDLMKEPIFCKMFQIMNNVVQLSDKTMFAEQIRHLLTVHTGRVPLNQLKELYFKEFGVRLETVRPSKSLYSKILSFASHVARITGNKWLIWATPNSKNPPRNAMLHKEITTKCPADNLGSTMLSSSTTDHLPRISLMNGMKCELLEDKVEYIDARNEQWDASGRDNIMIKQEELTNSSNSSQAEFQSGQGSSQEQVADELEMGSNVCSMSQTSSDAEWCPSKAHFEDDKDTTFTGNKVNIGMKRNTDSIDVSLPSSPLCQADKKDMLIRKSNQTSSIIDERKEKYEGRNVTICIRTNNDTCADPSDCISGQPSKGGCNLAIKFPDSDSCNGNYRKANSRSPSCIQCIPVVSQQASEISAMEASKLQKPRGCVTGPSKVLPEP